VNKRVPNLIYKNGLSGAAIHWNDSAIYGFVVKPTEHEHCLVDAVNSLPFICRKTVILFIFEQKTREHIAALLQTSLPAVCFLIHRSGLLLREYLTDHGQQSTPNPILNKLFANWPYREYAQLVKIRKNILFLKRSYSKL
jgi:hypothetical protein